MNGIEFKAIRMYNRISQTEFANAIGLRNRRSITNLEMLDIIPEKFVHILGKIIGINLLNEETAQDAYQKALDEFKRKKDIKRSTYPYYPPVYFYGQKPKYPWERWI